MAQLLKQTSGDLTAAARLAAAEIDNLKRRSDSVSASIVNMRNAAAQSQANAMAGQIAKLDPFQQTGTSAQQAGSRANVASMHFNKLRGTMTQLALTASGLPGPIGRVASVLSGFALGGGVTVAALAGIAAITLAWEKYTEGLRAADALMKKVREGQLQFRGPGGTESLRGAIEMGRAREARRAAELEAIQSQRAQTFLREGPIGLALNLMQQQRATEQLADEREFLAAATIALAKAERDLNTEVERANEDRSRGARQRFAIAQAEGVGAISAARQPWNPNAAAEATRAVAKLKNEQDAENAKIEVGRRLRGDNLRTAIVAIEYEKKMNDAIADGNYQLAKRLTREQQIAGAKMQLGQYALGAVAARAGPFGGIISGVGQGLMSGNPYAAAAGGLTGLVDGLISVGQAAKAAAQQVAQFKLAFASFINDIRLQLGDISQSQYDVESVKQAFDAQRKAVRDAAQAEKDAISPWTTRWHKAKREREIDEEAAKRIDELNELERRRIEQLGKEKDALNDMTEAAEQFRNVPSWFKVNLAVWRAAHPVGPGAGGSSPVETGPGYTPITRTGGGTAGPMLSIGSITINSRATNGKEIYDELMAEIKRRGLATFGSGEEARILATL